MESKKTKDQGGGGSKKKADEDPTKKLLTTLRYRGIEPKWVNRLAKLGITCAKDLEHKGGWESVWEDIPAKVVKEINQIKLDLEALESAENLKDEFTCGPGEQIVLSGGRTNFGPVVTQLEEKGHCWIEGTSDVVSNGYAIHKGQDLIVPLAKSEFLDSVQPQIKKEGRMIDEVCNWVKQNGVCRHNDYRRYDGEKRPCKPRNRVQSKRSIKIKDFRSIADSDHKELKRIVRRTPVTCDIWRDKEGEFDALKENVYQGSSTGNYKDEGHTVVLVGYCEHIETGRVLWWIFKNSHGPMFGLKGYGKTRARDSRRASILTSLRYPVFK